jgi:hypothetical protein
MESNQSLSPWMAPFADIFNLPWQATSRVTEIVKAVMVRVARPERNNPGRFVAVRIVASRISAQFKEGGIENATWLHFFNDTFEALSDSIERKMREDRLGDCEVEHDI